MEKYNLFKVGNPGCKYKRKLHDRALKRAFKCQCIYYLDKPDPQVNTVTYRTLFVYNISYETSEDTLRKKFETFGEIVTLYIVRDFVTGESNGYAFIEYASSYNAEQAYKKGHKMLIDSRRVFVDWERSRGQEGWIPRRLGGGLGGKKKSRQLRFAPHSS
ncbi:hypothetical protein SteCoe_747 [Stentor coeruleus]|uniref:RRM domain-containing protein n=1 Tax=Stentor coeruleus TaxID=5963 RepID=A0A1R2D3K3_9CILI|nr:hypothetical protein SteCoe_747 [Stentor coeruleus]